MQFTIPIKYSRTTAKTYDKFVKKFLARVAIKNSLDVRKRIQTQDDRAVGVIFTNQVCCILRPSVSRSAAECIA